MEKPIIERFSVPQLMDNTMDIETTMDTFGAVNIAKPKVLLFQKQKIVK